MGEEGKDVKGKEGMVNGREGAEEEEN